MLLILHRCLRASWPTRRELNKTFLIHRRLREVNPHVLIVRGSDSGEDDPVPGSVEQAEGGALLHPTLELVLAAT
jgi:hypothetical protein